AAFGTVSARAALPLAIGVAARFATALATEVAGIDVTLGLAIRGAIRGAAHVEFALALGSTIDVQLARASHRQLRGFAKYVASTLDLKLTLRVAVELDVAALFQQGVSGATDAEAQRANDCREKEGPFKVLHVNSNQED